MINKRPPQVRGEISNPESDNYQKPLEAHSVAASIFGKAGLSQQQVASSRNDRPFRVSSQSFSTSDMQLPGLGTGTLFLKTLDVVSEKIVRDFMGELQAIDRLLEADKSNHQGKEKILVVVTLLSEILGKYFSNPDDQGVMTIGGRLRASIAPQTVVSALSVIRLKEKPFDATLLSLETLADNLLEILLNTRAGRPPVDLLKRGPNIVTLFFYQIKCYLQQTSMLRSIHYPELEVTQAPSQFTSEFYKLLKRLTGTTLELCTRESVDSAGKIKISLSLQDTLTSEKARDSQDSIQLEQQEDHSIWRANDQSRSKECSFEPLLFSNYLEHQREVLSFKKAEMGERATEGTNSGLGDSFKSMDLVDNLLRKGIYTNF